MSELKDKLRAKAEKCRELEAELINMKELVERYLFVLIFRVPYKNSKLYVLIVLHLTVCMDVTLDCFRNY